MMSDTTTTDIEWTPSTILSALQSESLHRLESLAHICQTGEIRDNDEIFTTPSFYQTLIHSLKQAWKYHDHILLGGVSDDEHENFMYEMERQQEKKGKRMIIDDEEDEQQSHRNASEDGTVNESARDAAQRRLSTLYSIVSRILTTSEFSVTHASGRGAFDTNFINTLIARFEPKFKKTGNSAAASPQGAASLQSFTGVGGVAMGSSSSQTAAPFATSAKLAHVPQAILSTVGVGLSKHIEPDAPSPLELPLLRGLVHSVYLKFYTLRPALRVLFGNFFTRFMRTATNPQGVKELLSVYGAIAKGFQRPLHPVHREFLLKYIMPLHQPNGMLNELTPVLGMYHEALVYVLIQFLEKDDANTAATSAQHHPQHPQSTSLCETIITRILLGWPSAKAANSPKEVLLLHECEKLLEYCPSAASTSGSASASSTSSTAATSSHATPSQFHRIMSLFLPYLLQCINSYNHRVAERALQLWQNDKFRTLCQEESEYILPLLLPTLIQEEKHWNKSVNKMRGIVLGIFREMDLQVFTKVVHQYFVEETKKQAMMQASAPSSSTAATSSFSPPSSPAESLARIDTLISTLRPIETTKSNPEAELLQTQVRVASSLPEQVRYSDFVFGHILGSGSFSQVRYAQWIRRGTLPSSWPSYAVKIISKDLIKEQKYEKNVEREIEIMYKLIHENINRLVALCENATNKYLVLEYASLGDLHNHISKLGSLDTESARFVSAEILRALEEIHKNQIVFVDLKPENVLVHQSGHIKLSDFGSSRFFREVAEETRLEGTAEYLAPERLRGESVSPASDLWAFACVLYQMLAGRTPMWAEEQNAKSSPTAKPSSSSSAAAASSSSSSSSATEADAAAARDREMATSNAETQASMLRKMVAFESSTEDRYPSHFDPDAKDFIERVLKPNPAERIGVIAAPSESGVKWMIDYNQLKSHPFFSRLPFATLHTLPAPQLAGGVVAAAPDAVWARRKNSIMWAPMPVAYKFVEGSGVMEVIPEEREKETAAVAVPKSASGGSGSLRAQMMMNKLGTSVPRFGGVKEMEEEGDEEKDQNMMAEGDEEEDDDDEDDDADSMVDTDGSTMASRMSTAPLPAVASANEPRRPRQASSRAGGANVPPSSAAAVPLRPAIRSSVGLRPHLPPSGASAALPPKPSTMFSSVPRADACAGPTGLGMGVRQMGNSTASALLSRMNKAPGMQNPPKQ